jgi:chondroitin 4-sulfotransferase 11
MFTSGVITSKLRALEWRLIWMVSERLYERLKARIYKLGYPRLFDQTRSIFIHVPRAAGSTVAMALYERQITHYSWRLWYDINPRKFREYFKFAIIRDPIDRFRSSFRFLKAGGINDEDREFGTTALTRYESANELALASVSAIVQQKILGYVHFRPQAEFVADDSGRSMMDLLIPMPYLAQGLEIVKERLALEVRDLPKLNRARSAEPPEELSKEAEDILKCLYRTDFQLYELADQRFRQQDSTATVGAEERVASSQL